MDDIIAMARRAGAHDDGNEVRFVELRYLERFAALVAAPLQERIQDLYRQLNEAERELDSQYKLGMEAEREACAKVCDHMAARCNDIRTAALESAAENIRARSDK
jgi:hypothetical protein